MKASVMGAGPSEAPAGELSYKFQRLREKLRRAIESGELTGKLPGERALARRFHVNAKTLSKALTDLAAEGLLDRSIGRGTYVRGSGPVAVACHGKWLLLADAEQLSACTIEHLRKECADLEVITSVANLRPSFLNQFSAVIDLAESTPDEFVRDLLVRNIPVVAVNREPRAFSVHSVLPDVALGASRIGRDLLLGGHRRLGAIESPSRSVVSQALRQAVSRYAPDATIDSAKADEARELIRSGVSALVCGSVADAQKTRHLLEEAGIAVPEQVSLAAVGCSCPDAGCSGYFVECRSLAEMAIGILKDATTRPVTFWLPGTWVDRGTLAPVGSAAIPPEVAPPRHAGALV